MTRINSTKIYAPRRLGELEKRRPALEVRCAFCRGAGRDPFGIMSALSTCQVCGGAGRHHLRPPVAPCAFCRGKGIHPASRLTCTTCGGVGAVEIPNQAITCPGCDGSGRAADNLWSGSPFSCSRCQGQGVVAAEMQDLMEHKKDD